MDLKKLREMVLRTDSDSRVFTRLAALELLDTIERYEKALQNIQFVCTKGTATIFPRDTIETCAARAREALNPKEGV